MDSYPKNFRKKKVIKKNKSVVSARISDVLLSAMKSGTEDLMLNGYEVSSIARIFERALMETLRDIRVETGVDYYQLEEFRYEMENIVEKYQIKPNIKVDDIVNEIKETALKSQDKSKRRSQIREGIRTKKREIYRYIDKSHNNTFTSNITQLFDDTEN
jgi:hypothetical protein